MEKELAGVMFWTIDYDDFEGKFCNQGKYPLLTAVKDQLYTSLDQMEAIKLQQTKSTDFIPNLSINPVISTNGLNTIQNNILPGRVDLQINSIGATNPNSLKFQNSPLINQLTTISNSVASSSLNQDGSMRKHGTGKITNEKNTYEIAKIYEKLISLETTTTSTTTTSFTPLINFLDSEDDSHFICESDGLFVDMTSDCRVFFTCLWTNTRNAKKIRFICPEKTKFDQTNKVCDWEWKVDCTLN